ncbi:MAG: Gfo/Idh/MocA family oxidoreductase [Chloroflexi bacterium]|nr:Gfo/Idh/MocA family oxidoreductase [Chloroflexota bacterium]
MSHLVRIGFIGCGNHASQNIYPALRLGITGSPTVTDPIGELVACCDLDESRARRNARVFGFQRCYADYRTMLDKEDLDCVFAIMHPRIQARIAIDCLEAGKPVFVEKPPTETLDDASADKEACERSGQFVMIAFMKRFSEPYRRTRELMQRPEFGLPTAYEARYNFGRYVAPEVYDFLNAFSCHHLDLARFFMGDVASVYALYASRSGGVTGRPRTYAEVLNGRDRAIPQEEAWLLSLQFTSGAIGFLQTNCLERVQERVTITGQGSWVVVDDWRRVTAYLGNTEIPYYWEPNDQVPTDRLDLRTLHGYTGEVRHFVECVRDRRVATPNIDDGIAHLRLEQAAKRSALAGRPVALSEIG